MSKQISVETFCKALLKNLDNLIANLDIEDKTDTDIHAALVGGLVRIFGAEIHALTSHHLKVVKVLKLQDDRIKELERQVKELIDKENTQ